jgi:ribonuclease HI
MGDVVTIYTDGSCDNRIGDCGAAVAVIRYKDHYKEVVSGSWSSSTNNRMELLAIILALETVKAGFKIELTTDSEVCLKWIDNLVKDKPSDPIIKVSKNADLLLRLNKVLIKHNYTIDFKWVRGHIGVEGNERCDTLAKEAALWENPTRDIGSGIGECPDMQWFYHDSGAVFIDFTTEIDKNVSQGCDHLGKARKMSNKEVTQLLRDRGWKPKDIKELTIDKSTYKKPI